MILLLKSATVIDETSPFHQKKVDILIENGLIKQIATSIKAPSKCTEIKLTNLHISQGWFDTSVCLGEPGFEERETIDNGLVTAAKSGFTAVAVNPNTNPVTDNKASVEFLVHKSANALTKLYPIGALTKKAEGKDLAELFDMQNSGAIAFGDYNLPIENANLMKIALQYAQNFNGLILSFPEEQTISNGGLVNEDISSTKIGMKGIPSMAETLQIARDLTLLEYTGGKLHIPTISTASAVKLIKEAKKKGLDVTCSVSAHHIALNDEEIQSFDSNTKVLPPLRSKSDCKALIKGINEGTIDMITSDHNPIDVEHKKVEYQHAKFGTIGMESLFGAITPHLHLTTIITCLTTHPRKRFNIPTHSINIGEKADLTLFNPDNIYTFTEEHILSTSKNAIFKDKEMKGSVYGVIVGNKHILNS